MFTSFHLQFEKRNIVMCGAISFLMNRENSPFGWKQVSILLFLSVIFMLLLGGTASVIVWTVNTLKGTPGLAVFSIIMEIATFLTIVVVQLLLIGTIKEETGIDILNRIIDRLTDVNLLRSILGLMQRNSREESKDLRHGDRNRQ